MMAAHPFLRVVACGSRRRCPVGFAGLLGGAGCAILASLCNIDAPYRSDCTKFALIGLGIRIALSVIGYIAMLPFTAMLY